MATVAAPGLSASRQAFNFGRHFLEMCVAMCLGGAILAVLVFAGYAGLVGSANLRVDFPELSLAAIGLMLTAPMAAWMLLRGMSWRPVLEMGVVPVALAVAIIALVRTGMVASQTLQIGFGTFCGVSCAAMFIVMLFRLDMYTGRTAVHAM